MWLGSSCLAYRLRNCSIVLCYWVPRRGKSSWTEVTPIKRILSASPRSLYYNKVNNIPRRWRGQVLLNLSHNLFGVIFFAKCSSRRIKFTKLWYKNSVFFCWRIDGQWKHYAITCSWTSIYDTCKRTTGITRHWFCLKVSQSNGPVQEYLSKMISNYPKESVFETFIVEGSVDLQNAAWKTACLSSFHASCIDSFPVRWDQTMIIVCHSLGSRPILVLELFTLVPRLFGTTSRCLSVQPVQLLPSRNMWRHISLIWPFPHRYPHSPWPVDVTELSPRFCCWTLIWLSRHWAWLRRGYWRYRSLIDWLIDWSATYPKATNRSTRVLLFSGPKLWSSLSEKMKSNNSLHLKGSTKTMPYQYW